MNYRQDDNVRRRRLQRGFTLIELVVVIVLVGILSVYAAMNSSSVELTLPSQVRHLASSIRYTQTLAITSGNRMQLTFNTDSYSATCVPTAPATSCTPAVKEFTVGLEKGAKVVPGTDGVSPLQFNTRGEPETAANTPITAIANYKINLDGSTFFTVSIEPVTGFVTVSP